MSRTFPVKFSCGHYELIANVLSKVPMDAATHDRLVLHFNHIFRATQEEYNSAKFIEKCKQDQVSQEKRALTDTNASRIGAIDDGE